MYITSVQLMLKPKSNNPSEVRVINSLNADVLKIAGSEALSRQLSLMDFFSVAHLPSTIIEELKILPIFDKYHIMIKDQYGDSATSDEDECDEEEGDYASKGTNEIERWSIYNRRYTSHDDLKSDVDYKKLRSMVFHIEW